MTYPYRYLIASGDDPAPDLVDELCAWHDRMVAHLRRHGAGGGPCSCHDADDCPRADAPDLWGRASRTFGAAAASLTFLRRHAVGEPHA